MTNPLSADQVAELLKTPQRAPRSAKTTTAAVQRPRPIQIGPLGWSNETERCTFKGCASPTLVRVNGIPYCSTHSLYALNKMLIPDEYDLHKCDCNAGKHSMGNIHTEGCPLYDQVKRQ